jgi:hypothetical protein
MEANRVGAHAGAKVALTPSVVLMRTITRGIFTDGDWQSDIDLSYSGCPR